MKEFVRNCPVCNITITYKDKSRLNEAIKRNSKCQHGCLGALQDPSNKICSKCKKEKSYENFGKDSSRSNGFNSICKECSCQKSEKWRENNPDKLKKSNKQYNDKPKVKLRRKRWGKDNKERINLRRKKWRCANREKDNSYSRKRRAIKASVKENYTELDASITLKCFNNQCFNCKSIDNLCIDHHRPLSKGYPLSLNNAVILCNSCNTSKGAKTPEDFYGLNKCAKLDNTLSIIERKK